MRERLRWTVWWRRLRVERVVKKGRAIVADAVVVVVLERSVG